MHFSHYGRMCPIETPEGPNIGLIGALATFARVNEFGFIESPYRKVVNGKVTDEIVYLAADEEEEYVVAQANAPLNPDGTLHRGPRARAALAAGRHARRPEAAARARRLLRRHHRDLATCRRTRSSSWTSRRSRSSRSATALIPFLEHDDANRALMGANMQKQAVPLVRAEAPYIGTGVEARAARDAADMILAEDDGTVTEVDGDVDHRRVQDAGPQGLPPAQVRALEPGHLHQPEAASSTRATRSRRATSSPTAPPPTTASWRSARTCSSPSCRGRATTSRTPSSCSERLVKDDVLTSIHIHEHEIDARDTKLGPEEITRDIPNLSEEILADLDERGIIRIGAEVGAGDVLVGKVTPKGETELTPEERLLRAIFGEKAREVRDTSLKVPHGETGKVIDVKVFSRDESHELPPGVNQLVRVYVGPEAQDQRGRQARRPPRQQGRHLQDPPDRGHAVHGRRHPRRHHPQPARRAVPHERGPGARGAPRLRRPLGLGRSTATTVGDDADPRHRDARPAPHTPAVDAHRHAGVRRRPLGRGGGGRQAPDHPADLREPAPRGPTTSTATAAG